MGILFKSDEEIEKIIQNYKGNKKKLVKVSRNNGKLLGYSERPEKENYENYIEYVKNFIKHMRLHNSGDGYYFGLREFKDEIINNYGNYNNEKKGRYGYLIEGDLLLNRHLKDGDIFKNSKLGFFLHNLSPNILKYLLLNYMVKKYNLDSYEVGGMKKIEILVWKYVYKINAVIDGDYLIFKNKDNFKISNITKIERI